ncbi:helix-turn-helix domain-containing protein [Streptosporangium carneum]|uniref:Transcriptional regulator n=1 Tax=Streptosporangium carneum TaxID=47481 RepID=A0A9W6I6R1_9ACTN|nr:helix-turn-helix transcriptional regulator [Streptosporangium carneum]GLK12203.1 transcriptional regulator [Streptosporangium carneum]
MAAARAAGDLGAVVRLVRRARSLTQAQLGSLLCCSASTVSRLETGEQPLTNVAILQLLAQHLSIPPAVLGLSLDINGRHAAFAVASPWAVPPTTVGRDDHDEDGGDPMRRRALLTNLAVAGAAAAVPDLLSRVDDALAVLPTPSAPALPEQIASRLAQARASFDAGDLGRLVAGLPDLLALAHEAAETHATATAYAQAAACYDLATDALLKVGRHEASRITADRAVMLAGLSGAPISMAASARSLSMVLRHEGRREIADRLILQAVNRVEAAGLDVPAHAAAYAQMLCTCAYTAAQVGDRDRALEMIRQAAYVAARLPSQAVSGRPFAVSPAHVSLYEVGVRWSLGDAGAAVHAGRSVHPSQLLTPERRGRLHTDLARAWWQWGKPEQTASALLNACQESVGEVRTRPAIRAMAVALINQYPRVSGVQTLATTIGYRH